MRVQLENQYEKLNYPYRDQMQLIKMFPIRHVTFSKIKHWNLEKTHSCHGNRISLSRFGLFPTRSPHPIPVYWDECSWIWYLSHYLIRKRRFLSVMSSKTPIKISYNKTRTLVPISRTWHKQVSSPNIITPVQWEGKNKSFGTAKSTQNKHQTHQINHIHSK